MRIPAIVVHGGAGRQLVDLDDRVQAGCDAAAEAGWTVLARGGRALDAVMAAVIALEDDPHFNAGVGSCLTDVGTVEMDASIMDGATLAGAGVGAVTTVANPVRLAHAVLIDGRHALLAGSGAEAFARQCGLPTVAPASLVTERQRQRWQARVRDHQGGTVGAVAVDARGDVAAATSTGGTLGKLVGRIGDSAVIGAGTYADNRAGAASATGHGEAIIIAGLAKAAVDALRTGRDPATVAAAVVAEAARPRGALLGLILVDRFGRIGIARHAETMPTCARGNGP
jgi:beta-aspartyl-peptidase (threonine type)